LNPGIGNLSKLESLDLTGNQLTELPLEMSNLKSLRKLKLAKNKLRQLPVSILSNTPKLSELEIPDNQLFCLFSGFEEGGLSLPSLVRLDARNNGMERITDLGGDDESKPKIEMKSLKELMLSQNALSSLENLLFALPQLYYLDIRANQFITVPTGVFELSTLRNLDMSSNQMELVPPELGNMTELTTFVWDFNPIKNVPRSTNSTEALMKLLRRRLETDGPSSSSSKFAEANVN
jgi:Leucine-rich repeat (LRR) protein